MTKFCKNCNTENPDDFLVCKNCGKLLSEDVVEGIRIGKRTIFVILLIIVAIAYKLSFKVYDKTVYRIAALPDKERRIKIVDFKIPQKWVPVGKLVYNPKSIPNMYTFFVAGINPKENVDIQFFSTQFETESLANYKITDYNKVVLSEQYLAKVLKKLAPNAKNVKFVADLKPSKEAYIFAEKEKTLFSYLYKENNPQAEKGKSWIEQYEVKPIKYLYSYEEKDKKYYHLLEGIFVFFIQCFSNDVNDYSDGIPEEENTSDNSDEEDDESESKVITPVHTAIKFIKCEDMFSYQAEENLYNKYLPQYQVFKDSININPKWLEQTNLQRRETLSKVSYLTTISLDGGDNFNVEKFKNTVFYLEYLDETTKFNMNLSFKDAYKKIEKDVSKKYFLY